MQYQCAIGDALANAGHNVTVFAPVGDMSLLGRPCGYNKKKRMITPIMGSEFQEQLRKVKELMQNFYKLNNDPSVALEHITESAMTFTKECEAIVALKDDLEKLREEHFDVGISEPMILCGFGIFKDLGMTKIISAPSFPVADIQSWAIGEPLAPSYVPGVMSGSGDKMSFLQRTVNGIAAIAGVYAYKYLISGEIDVIAKAFPAFSNIEDLFGDVSLVFLNSHPYMNYPRPMLHKTVEVGGITVENAVNSSLVLDKKWDDILNEREHTVLVSFGTVMQGKDMPEQWKNNMFKLFSEMPDVTFIWKFEDEEKPSQKMENVHLVAWMPQKALLADSRLSLFVSHAGIGSVTEIAYMGTPSITIPIFGDQVRNAAMLARHGGSVNLDNSCLENTELLKTSICKILADKSHKENAVKLSEIVKNCPVSSTDLIVKHAEFVARFGPLHQLDSYSRNLSIFQIYFVDAILLGISICALSTSLLIVCCLKLYKRFVRKEPAAPKADGEPLLERKQK